MLLMLGTSFGCGCEGAQTLEDCVIQLFIFDAPTPVSGRCSRNVHAGVATESEQILEGRNGDSRFAIPDLAQHRFGDIFGPDLFAKHLANGLQRRFAQRIEPTTRRIVIMGAREGGAVFVVVLRQKYVVWITIKSELQNSHTGHAIVDSQLMDVVGEQPQVFGDKRQAAQ